jgi:drug/metabolite transporter (DMT)-like permease
MPMFIAILSWIILGDRPSIYRASGLIALLLGLLMMGRGGFWKVRLVLGRVIYYF